MTAESKRQWMQSFNGRIRVGPKYQAMIPPFCRQDKRIQSGDEQEQIAKTVSPRFEFSMQSYGIPIDKHQLQDEQESEDILKYLRTGMQCIQDSKGDESFSPQNRTF
ncbi:ELM2 domain [Babesia duncani]|uniref:ELM2 domain n=1 Tax=Babesia duncani TaxID=323732 RepID=A0AAD9PM21_9APIC|nr:ELM2 domain [Babesia duncani]